MVLQWIKKSMSKEKDIKENITTPLRKAFRDMEILLDGYGKRIGAFREYVDKGDTLNGQMIKSTDSKVDAHYEELLGEISDATKEIESLSSKNDGCSNQIKNNHSLINEVFLCLQDISTDQSDNDESFHHMDGLISDNAGEIKDSFSEIDRVDQKIFDLGKIVEDQIEESHSKLSVTIEAIRKDHHEELKNVAAVKERCENHDLGFKNIDERLQKMELAVEDRERHILSLTTNSILDHKIHQQTQVDRILKLLDGSAIKAQSLEERVNRVDKELSDQNLHRQSHVVKMKRLQTEISDIKRLLKGKPDG